MSTKIKYKGETVTSIEGGQTATLHLTDKKLTDDLIIEASGGSNLPTYNGEYISLGIKLISFTIDGVTYQAVEGMTWADWVADTNYNTIGAQIHFSRIFDSSKYEHIIRRFGLPSSKNYADVKESEEIYADKDYQWINEPIVPDDNPPK